jgi:microcystin-dependent protein
MEDDLYYGSPAFFNDNATFFGDVTVYGNLNFDKISYESLYVRDGATINQLGIAQTALVVNGSTRVTGTSTLGNTVVGGGTTQLIVNGNARVTGILTIGTGSITVDGTNNTITGLTSITDSSGGYLSNPPGTIITVASSTAPAGHLKANGASLSTTTYAALFAAIGYTFGGSGASFTLPDLRGEFIRGWDDARGVDSGRGFGSAQSQAIQSHTHGIRVSGADDNNHTGNGTAAANSDAGENATNSTESAGGTETRPRNIALLHCIKY